MKKIFFYAGIFFLLLLSPAAAGWQKINPSESKLQILNEDGEFPHECFALGWSASKSSRSWGCKSYRNGGEAYLITFQELAPGTAFGEFYTIQQLNKNRKIFQNSRFGSQIMVKTDQTAFEAYQSSRSDRNCYAFKNQDGANYGDNELNGRWLISGYFCHKTSENFKLTRLETFINRVSIDGLFKGRYTLTAPTRNESKKGPENNSTVKAGAQSLEQKLTKLKGLFDQGLIPKSVYDQKVNELLNSD